MQLYILTIRTNQERHEIKKTNSNNIEGIGKSVEWEMKKDVVSKRNLQRVFIFVINACDSRSEKIRLTENAPI